MYRARRARARARDRPSVPDRSRVRPLLNARAPGRGRPGRGRRAGDRHGRPDRRRRPADRDVLEGHAPARQDRRRARPRPVDPAPRRAVQRDGPAPAPAHDGRCSGAMAAEGRTILFSSHILEEVERLAESVLVVYAGRLAASGDFRSIRRLMTDRPHTFTIRSSDDRTLAAALMANPAVFGVDLLDGRVAIQDERSRDLRADRRARGARGRDPPARARRRPTTRSRACSATWSVDEGVPGRSST